MSKFKSVSKASDYDDYSIVAQNIRNYKELTDPPEIEIPVRDYSQRAENSGLPDGSDYNETLDAPIGETLDKFAFRLSTEANEMWKKWTAKTPEGELPMPIILKNGSVISPLEKPIEDILIEDKAHLTRMRRLAKVESILTKRKEEIRVSRKVQVCTNLGIGVLSENSTEPVQVNDSVRYYKETKITPCEFGGVIVEEVIKDRCKGNPFIKVEKGIKVADIQRTSGAPTHRERAELINMTCYQTEIWRTPARIEDKLYVPNIGMRDDPDFIPPSSFSKKNFTIYPPASRPYNTVFRVYYGRNPNYVAPSDGGPCDLEDALGDLSAMYLKSKVIYPTNKKDYTSLSSIKYMLKEKGMKDFTVIIDDIKTGKKTRPNCKFEVDLRVTYNSDNPNPKNYKKVDPDSIIGKRILQLLNEQPYIFNEFSWVHEDEMTHVVDKKAAVGLTVGKDDQKKIYWVYLDESKNTQASRPYVRPTDHGKYKITLSNITRVPPQYIYRPLRHFTQDRPNYQKVDQPFMATVRVSDGYSFSLVTEDGERIFKKFNDVKNDFFNVLLKKGYLYVKQENESHYNNVLLFHFIHESTKTPEKRKSVFLTQTQTIVT